MKNVALYQPRVNIKSNGHNQRIRLVEFAERNGFTMISLKKLNQPAKQDPSNRHCWLKLRAGKYDAVVVYKLDRWARSSTELILDTKELIDKGIGFISISDNLDFGTASGKLHFQILSAFAEFERELIRERTIEGLRRSKMQGKTPGRPKGSKDSTKRKRSGYILREARKRQLVESDAGIHKSIETYLN